MDTIQRARGALAQAEKTLRSIIEESLAQHQYSDVAQVAQMADGLARLLSMPPAVPARDPALVVKKAKEEEDGREAHKRRSQPSKTAYPKFFRESNRLVKIGWSKKRREEYEHRAPIDSVTAFTRHLVSHVSPDRLFSMDALLPVPDGSGGEVPAYQAYLTLAWLRNLALLKRKGRDGYVLRKGVLLNGDVESLWSQLPERSA